MAFLFLCACNRHVRTLLSYIDVLLAGPSANLKGCGLCLDGKHCLVSSSKMNVFDGSSLLFDGMPQRSIFGRNHFIWILQCFKSIWRSSSSRWIKRSWDGALFAWCPITIHSFKIRSTSLGTIRQTAMIVSHKCFVLLYDPKS